MAKVLQFSRHVNTGEPLLSSSALESRGSIHPLSADRGNEGRRVANCTDSRRFSVSRRSLQHPLPRRLALLAGGSTPLSTTTATAALRHPLCCPLLAQAPPLLCTLYPILIHIRVSTATSTQGQREISRFTTSSCGFHGLRVYVAPGSTVRSFFFSLFFSFLFFSYATRKTFARPLCQLQRFVLSLSLLLFLPLTLSTASFHRSPVSSCTECLRSLPGILSPLPRRNWDVYPGISSSSWFLERLPDPRHETSLVSNTIVRI